ncbi:DUF2779 domain-containing protein [Mycoplasmopsis bovigenitalium]|uniref:UU173 family protein n=1 Tax=Mycoplasmopsis bovigenitalium TaxID=2112 RepID=UPI00090AF65A|nr:DUF2779 domain-containing protein [Mycoplasmopsis bovigenitalium]BAW18198.1 DUF2779 domain-containing protein [Mycoplasmopsis bovigenitalium]
MKISNFQKLDKEKDVVITFNHYRDSYIAQDYFIWAPKDSDGLYNIPNIDANEFKLYELEKTNEAKSSTTMHNFAFSDIEDDEEDELLDKIYKNQNEAFLSNEWNYKSENKGMFEKAYSQAVDFLIKSIDIPIEKVQFNKRIYTTETLHNANQNIIDFIFNDDKELIIDPVFVYKVKTKENFYVKATCFAYDKTSKTLFLYKPTSSTKINDYLTAHFVYNTAINCGLVVQNVKFIIFDPSPNRYKKGTISFVFTEGIQSSQSTKSVGRKGVTLYKEENEIKLSEQINAGWVMQKGICEGIPTTIINAVKNNLVWANPRQNKDGDLSKLKYNKNEKCVLFDFDQKIAKIIEARQITLPVYSEIKNGVKTFSVLNSDTSWAKNKILNNTIKNLYLGDKYLFSAGHNGCNAAQKGILDQNYINIVKSNVDSLYAFPNYFSSEAIELISELLVKDQSIVWYDYEGVTNLIPLFDNLKSWRQVPSQVSVIKTINGAVNYQNDIVKDPKNLELIDLVDIILEVYQNKADKYVVFNKNYENSRNLEIRDFVENEYKKSNKAFIYEMEKRNIKSFLEFQSIVLHIINNTFDLLWFFNKAEKPISSNNLIFGTKYVPYSKYHNPIFDLDFQNFTGTLEDYVNVCKNAQSQLNKGINDIRLIRIVELLGFTSIKKLEKMISKNKYKYRFSIKEYANLDVKNGSMALEIAISRSSGMIGETQWNAKLESLKEYCHNDVVAMIVVYEFILNYIASVFPNILDFEFKIEKNQILKLDFDNKKLMAVNNEIQ